MNSTVLNGKRKLLVARAASGLLASGLLWFAGIGQAAPEIRWTKVYTPRLWTYAAGTTMTASYDSYKNGNVYVIADGNEKRTIAISRLSAQDQAWVLDELKKPHGQLNDVVFSQWQDQRPVFQINASFIAKGNQTESPVVLVQYLLLDQQRHAIKRVCDPVVLYPTVGKQNLEQLGTKVLRQCLGQKEEDDAGVKRLAYRAVMLLLNDKQKEWLVLDTFSNQDDLRLRALGVPSDWWEPRYPVGALSAPIMEGGAK